jgi:hypothetical protein
MSVLFAASGLCVLAALAAPFLYRAFGAGRRP